MKQDHQKLQHQLILGISRRYILPTPNICYPAGITLAFPIRKQAWFSLCQLSTCLCSALCVGINWSMQVSRKAKQASQGHCSLLHCSHGLLSSPVNVHSFFLVSLQLKNCNRNQKEYCLLPLIFSLLLIET